MNTNIISTTDNFDIMNIEGVRCYSKEGEVYLSLEDVCKGFGFTQYKNGIPYVRWSYVRNVFAKIGYCGKAEVGVYIPENIFYRLAMYSRSKASMAFKNKVADIIVPTVRRHGIYATDEMIDRIIDDPNFGIRVLTELREEREKRQKLEEKVQADAPLVDYANTVSSYSGSISVNEFSKLVTNRTGIEIGQNRMYRWLRLHGYLMYGYHNIPYQKYIDNGYFVVKQEVNGKSVTRHTRITGKGQVALYDKITEHLRDGKELV